MSEHNLLYRILGRILRWDLITIIYGGVKYTRRIRRTPQTCGYLPYVRLRGRDEKLDTRWMEIIKITTVRNK